MKTVYKYPIPLLKGEATHEMQGKILYVGVQKASPGHVCVWAEYDQDAEPVETSLFVIGSGHPIVYDGEYVGSAVDEPFVWHVYRKI